MELSPPKVPRPSVDPDRTGRDPLPPLTSEDSTVIDALTAVLTADEEAVSRPGQLRRRLEVTLGPEQAARLRPLVHQVVVAAEENLPGYLTRITPLTSQSLRQLSGELAAARGWNQATAQRVTQIWAHALGFGEVSQSWAPGEPARAPVRVADGVTALPASVGPPPPSWPPTRRRLAKSHPASSTGEPVAAAAWGYAGIPPQAYVAGVVAVVSVVVLVLVLFKVLVGGLLIVLLVVLLRRAQRPGAVLATARGLEFVPYSAFAGKPKGEGGFAAPWQDVAVDEGSFSVLRLAGRRVRLGPTSRGFAHAAATRAGGGV